jgi:hypothetical protein
MTQTFGQPEILDVQPHFIPFFKTHLSSGLVLKVFVPFMCLLKIGLGPFPQEPPLFIKLCDHGHFLTRITWGLSNPIMENK